MDNGTKHTHPCPDPSLMTRTPNPSTQLIKKWSNVNFNIYSVIRFLSIRVGFHLVAFVTVEKLGDTFSLVSFIAISWRSVASFHLSTLVGVACVSSAPRTALALARLIFTYKSSLSVSILASSRGRVPDTNVTLMLEKCTAPGDFLSLLPEGSSFTHFGLKILIPTN